GKVFHDGGWFDSSAGKPRIQVRRTSGGKWETVTELASYPQTTATDPGSLKQGSQQSFTQSLGQRVKVVGVRVVGRPACGDSPHQAFGSCGELAAYGSP